MNRDEIVPDELTTTGGPELVSTPVAHDVIAAPSGGLEFVPPAAKRVIVSGARTINEVASGASTAGAPQ